MSVAVPILVLDGVRARDRAGPGGRPRGHLFGLDAVFGPGVHAVLGAPEDGTLALAELVSGRVAPLAGRVSVGGCEPARSASIRARLGVLAAAPELPDTGKVAFAVGLALRARGAAASGAAALLERFGIASLLARRCASLSFAEARAVELALALTTPAPLLVGLFEPFCDVAVPSPSRVQQQLRDLGAAGVCVVVFTSSPADARGLADRIHVLDRGVIARIERGGDRLVGGPRPRAGAPPALAELLVLVKEGEASGAGAEAAADAEAAAVAAPDRPGVRALAAALARSPAVRAIAWEEASEASFVSALRIQAEDRDAAALAILDAAVAVDVTVLAISSPSPSLQKVRAATAAHLALLRPLRSFGAPAPVQAASGDGAARRLEDEAR